MSAEALGRRVLDQVMEERLDELLASLAALTPTPTPLGIPLLDSLLAALPPCSSPPSLPIISLTSPAPCSGKTQLLYHIAAQLALGIPESSPNHAQTPAAVVILDADASFSVARLATVMASLLPSSSSSHAPTGQPHLHLQNQNQRVEQCKDDEMVHKALSRILLFRPQSLAQLLATANALADLPVDVETGKAGGLDGGLRVGAVVLDSAGAFYWPSRDDMLATDVQDEDVVVVGVGDEIHGADEDEAGDEVGRAGEAYAAARTTTNDKTKPPQHQRPQQQQQQQGRATHALVAQALQRAAGRLRAPLIYTRHAHTPLLAFSTSASASSSSTTTATATTTTTTTGTGVAGVHGVPVQAQQHRRIINLSVHRRQVRRFPPMSAEEALRERERRTRVVERGEFEVSLVDDDGAGYGYGYAGYDTRETKWGVGFVVNAEGVFVRDVDAHASGAVGEDTTAATMS